jgi:uncharacterized membrane protein YhaH (DUF805 family)
VGTTIAWFGHCLRHYAQFAGRASRPEWWFWAVATVVGMVLRILSHILWAGWIVLVIWSAGVVVPHLAVGSRRLHDAGHSFWWVAPPIVGVCLIIVTGAATRGRGPLPHLAGPLLAFLVVWLGFTFRLVFLLCKPSNDGPNRYGDSAPTVPN